MASIEQAGFGSTILDEGASLEERGPGDLAALIAHPRVKRITIDLNGARGESSDGGSRAQQPQAGVTEETYFPQGTKDGAAIGAALIAGGVAFAFAPDMMNFGADVLADAAIVYASTHVPKYVVSAARTIAAIPGGIGYTRRDHRGSSETDGQLSSSAESGTSFIPPTTADPQPLGTPDVQPQAGGQRVGARRVRTGAKIVLSLGAGVVAAKLAPHGLNVAEDIPVYGAGAYVATWGVATGIRRAGRFLHDIPAGVRKELNRKKK